MALQPPNQEELVLCLPCGGQCLSGLEATLPYTRKNHDLIENLALMVIKDANPHPKRPPNEIMSTILSTATLTNVVMSEIRNYGISMKSLANALEMNAATFSLCLREPRHWFDANQTQRRCYYNLYLWLNLPHKYRRSTLRSSRMSFIDNAELTFDSDDENPSPLENLPKINALNDVFALELNQNNINLDHFATKILNIEDNLLLRNMILTPLPWEMMSLRMKKKYAQIWYWLKQRAAKRLELLGMTLTNDHPDTVQVARQVLQQLNTLGFNLVPLIQDVCPGLSASIMNSLLYKPVDWSLAKSHEQYLYLSLMKWLGYTNTGQLDREINIDTFGLAKAAMNFIRQNNVTVTDFAEKVAKFPRANVSLYFNSPMTWAKAKSPLRSAYINVRFWMEQDPEKRLEKFKTHNYLTPSSLLTPKIEIHEDLVANNDDVVQEALEVISMIKENLDKEDLDTENVAQTMKGELRKAGISMKGFAGIVKVNRNYFASLINTPVKWSLATKLQKFVYQSMMQWIEHRRGLFLSGSSSMSLSTTRLALKPLNGEINGGSFRKKRGKQTRVRFSPEQRQYLLEAFKTNPRPSTQEKLIYSKHLGVSLRTVVIFFCNRRTRHNNPK